MTKRVVLFGSGTVAEQNLHLNPQFIVDNNPDLEGAYFNGVEIRSPQELNTRADLYDVVVCSTSVSEIRRQLQSYGYTWDKNARVADQLIENLEIAKLEGAEFKFLISSGLPSSNTTFSDGGIYIVEESTGYPEISKIYDGNTHGLISYSGGYAFTCQGVGIVVLGSNFAVENIIKLRDGLRPHGIQRYKDMWVVVSSYQDCIVAVNDDGEEQFEIKLSQKQKRYSSAQHHCNDLCVVDDYAYVSMFSVSGNWKRGIFDGGVVEIDLVTSEHRVIVNNLTMPHNISFYDKNIRVMNSFKGEILTNNFEVYGQLPGFVRGYDEDPVHIFVGESKNRNFSRLKTARTPVSIDTRITIINKGQGFSRSIGLPKGISEIHALLKL